MINMNTTYETREGKEVILMSVTGHGKYPVIGYSMGDDGDWHGQTWSEHGEYYRGEESEFDLVPKKSPIKLTYDQAYFIYNLCHFVSGDHDKTDRRHAEDIIKLCESELGYKFDYEIELYKFDGNVECKS